MRRFLFCLILLFLLPGCGTGSQIAESTLPDDTTVSQEPGLYEPDSLIETQTAGAVTAFPLKNASCRGFERMGEDLLLFYTEEDGTVLQLLSGDTLRETCSVKLNSQIFPEEPDVRVSEQGIGYFDSEANAVIFLNTQLEEIRRMQVPDTVQGTPVLARDWSTIYFCTEDAIRGLDLRTGNPRLIRKDDSCQWQTLNQLYRNDTVLQYTAWFADTEAEIGYISVENGKTLFTGSQVEELYASGDWYFARIRDGIWWDYVFGKVDGEAHVLNIPEEVVSVYPVLDSGCVMLLSVRETESVAYLFDLEQERTVASVSLTGITGIYDCAVDERSSSIWMLDYDAQKNAQTLYRWDMTRGLMVESQLETEPYYTADNPDVQGLEQCQIKARAISETYQVDLDIWDVVTVPEPDGYTYTAEYRVDAIEQGLTQLEQALAVYPQDFLKQAASITTSGVIHISLLRAITGDPQMGTLTDCVGVQFWTEGGEAYIGLALSENMAGSLYHEIFHILDSYVLSSCVAYDDWNALNPSDFAYDYDYVQNQNRTEETYLDGENRAFVDLYAMSYPKEDRARIMEYAMLPDQQEVFESSRMQNKLTVLCRGIRKAFDLEDVPELPWEVYLKESLASQ